MSHQLLLEVDWEQGTLQRLVGLIERRGFEVIGLELHACGGARQIALEVQAHYEAKDFAVLCRQIDRLYGVNRLDALCADQSFALRHRFPLVG